jgi:hypothetical protein
MITRRCTHCDAEIELPESRHSRCPVCGMDPDQPRATFDDAPPFYFAFEVGDAAAPPAATTQAETAATGASLTA